jgi:hypothetical protein
MIVSSSQSLKLPSIKTLGLVEVPKKIYDYNLSNLMPPPLKLVQSQNT